MLDLITQIYAIIEGLKVIPDNNLKKMQVEDMLIELLLMLKK